MLMNDQFMILAQSNNQILIPVGIGVIGVYIWVSCHIANRRRHPDAESIIYKNFCQEAQKRMDDRHNASEKRADERHGELKEQIVELKALIINNGRSK